MRVRVGFELACVFDPVGMQVLVIQSSSSGVSAAIPEGDDCAANSSEVRFLRALWGRW